MVAVCGIELAINASFASAVPGTDAQHTRFGIIRWNFREVWGHLPRTHECPRSIERRAF
jgi:hypothetical protein